MREFMRYGTHDIHGMTSRKAHMQFTSVYIIHAKCAVGTAPLGILMHMYAGHTLQAQFAGHECHELGQPILISTTLADAFATAAIATRLAVHGTGAIVAEPREHTTACAAATRFFAAPFRQAHALIFCSSARIIETLDQSLLAQQFEC